MLSSKPRRNFFSDYLLSTFAHDKIILLAAKCTHKVHSIFIGHAQYLVSDLLPSRQKFEAKRMRSLLVKKVMNLLHSAVENTANFLQLLLLK